MFKEMMPLLIVCLSCSVFSTRVSNELGAGRPRAAQVAISVGITLTISQACVTSLLYLCLRNVLGRAFSNDIDVIQNVAILLKLVAISSFLDSTQGVLSGVKPKSTSYVWFSVHSQLHRSFVKMLDIESDG